MQPFKQLASTAIPLDLNDVDTDLIIPAQYLTKIERDGYGQYLFQRLKEQDPHFVFNNAKYQQSAILLSRKNFGCGSSREHAVWALQQVGIQAIVAESYSDIFYNNAAKNGLLLISLPHSTIAALMIRVQNEEINITLNLESQTLSISNNEIFHFDYDPFRKECLLKGLDDLDYLLEATNA